MSRRSRSWTTFSSLARRIGGAFRRSPWAFSAAAAAAFTALWLLRYGPYALGVGLVPTVGLLFLFFCVGLLHGLDRVLPVALLLVLGLTLLAGAAVDLVAGKAGYDVGFTQWSYVEALSAALSVSGAYAAGYFIASSSSYTTRPLHAEEAKAERAPRPRRGRRGSR